MTQEEVIEIVKNNNPIKFKKSGTFRFEIAEEEQEIVTEINGEVETKNTAKVGDYILTGASGEKYILKPETFMKRYKIIHELNATHLRGTAQATGECFGNIYKGEPITFIASWGEGMVCNPGDYLVSPSSEYTQAYRIEAETFNKTYKQA